MGSSFGTLVVCAVLLALASPARADTVRLVDGAVIEGQARRAGDKVVIELDSGEITLEADDVASIEEGPTVLERLAKLTELEQRRGVPGWMALADFCRDQGLRTREVLWLEKVIAREPDHGEARARLGYVRDEAADKWIKRDELVRARELADEQARVAAQARLKATLELEAQKVALERERLKLERERAAQSTVAEDGDAPAPSPVATPYTVYGGYVHSGHHDPCDHDDCRRARPPRRSAFPIAGVRDPRDPSWRIPGVKDPSAKERRRER